MDIIAKIQELIKNTDLNSLRDKALTNEGVKDVLKSQLGSIDYAAIAKDIVTEIKGDYSGYKSLSDESKAQYELLVKDIAELSLKAAVLTDPVEQAALQKEIDICQVSVNSIDAVQNMYLMRKTIDVTGKILAAAGKAAITLALL
jgi:hypothetical protein